LQGADLHELALNACVAGGLWDRARAVAGHVAGGAEAVQEAYVAHLKEHQAADELIAAGNAAAGLDMLAEQGQWEKCLRVASEQGPAVVTQCVPLGLVR
jgi:intraflagellar transport protein 172